MTAVTFEFARMYKRACKLSLVCADCVCGSTEPGDLCDECRELIDLRRQLKMAFRVRPWCDLPTDQPADAPRSLKWWGHALEQALQEARIPLWERRQ
jgi:hypothetical protein